MCHGGAIAAWASLTWAFDSANFLLPLRPRALAALNPARVRSRITACGTRRCCSTCAMRSALATSGLARSRCYGDIRKTLLSAPAVVDADRSLPVPASPHDWLAERKFALDEGLHRVATCRPTFNVKTLTVGFRPLPQTTRRSADDPDRCVRRTKRTADTWRRSVSRCSATGR